MGARVFAVIDTCKQNPSSLWPPPYTVRRSARAKRIFLQISPAQGLEIVVPSNRKRSIPIEALLNEKRGWIEKVLLRFQKKALIAPLPPPILEHPSLLECQAIFSVWHIRYHPLTHRKRVAVKIIEKGGILWAQGQTEDLSLCHQALKKWVIKEASRILPLWLNELSLLTGLSYNQVTVRAQNTLWGSCNAKKNISLNYKLLFFPRSVAEHVLLHELCHTKHLNHSAHFWQLLKQLDANFEDNKHCLKTAERYLPRWLVQG